MKFLKLLPKPWHYTKASEKYVRLLLLSVVLEAITITTKIADKSHHNFPFHRRIFSSVTKRQNILRLLKAICFHVITLIKFLTTLRGDLPPSVAPSLGRVFCCCCCREAKTKKRY